MAASMPVDEQLRKFLRVPGPAPVHGLIGMELSSVGSGIAGFTMTLDERHHNPMGSVHGGILADLADAAMGTAVITTLTESETFTTLEVKINFIRPVFRGLVRCQAQVVNRGRNIAYCEADITNEDGKLVAKAVSTNMVLHREGEDAFHHRERSPDDPGPDGAHHSG